jgi:hypothetical protein
MNIHEKLLEFLRQYKPLAAWFFNVNKAEHDTINVIPVSGEKNWLEQWIDGSGIGYLDFHVNIFKTLSDVPIADDDSGAQLPIQNAEDLFDVQQLMDWINQQNEGGNFPDLGDSYEVQKLEALTNIPNPAMTDGTLIKLSFPGRITFYKEGDN